MLNNDYKEMLQGLLKNKVKFLVIGAYAMGMHGYPRATGDLDLWIEPSLENSRNLYNALTEFGSPLDQINPETFSKKKVVFQIGLAPRRIDMLTFIDGIEFDEAYKDKNEIKIDNINVPFLSKENIIKNKEATGREKDKLDVAYLKNNKHV